MCRLRPILDRTRPGLLENGGALPRIGDVKSNGMRQADIPSLAQLGIHTLSAQTPGQPVRQTECTDDNIYNVYRDARPSPCLQRGVDFDVLLMMCCRERSSCDRAQEYAKYARNMLSGLHYEGRRCLDLFEIFVVFRAVGDERLAELKAAEGEDEASEEQETLTVYRDFSTMLLTAAIGSNSGEVPRLPHFFGGIRNKETGKLKGMAKCIADYVKV